MELNIPIDDPFYERKKVYWSAKIEALNDLEKKRNLIKGDQNESSKKKDSGK